jgi:hypothetical protein
MLRRSSPFQICNLGSIKQVSIYFSPRHPEGEIDFSIVFFEIPQSKRPNAYCAVIDRWSCTHRPSRAASVAEAQHFLDQPASPLIHNDLTFLFSHRFCSNFLQPPFHHQPAECPPPPTRCRRLRNPPIPRSDPRPIRVRPRPRDIPTTALRGSFTPSPGVAAARTESRWKIWILPAARSCRSSTG